MLLNIPLIREPMNWIIVLAMVMIGFIVLDLVLVPFASPATEN